MGNICVTFSFKNDILVFLGQIRRFSHDTKHYQNCTENQEKILIFIFFQFLLKKKYFFQIFSKMYMSEVYVYQRTVLDALKIRKL